jgi:ATP:ADP antiporter, AAA family
VARRSRILGISVERSERGLALLLAVDLFLLLAAYYVLKVIREPLILLGGGVASRNIARGVQALLLLAFVPLYGAIANRMDPLRLVRVVVGVFLASLVGFHLAARTGTDIGFPFFVWLGIFSTFSIAQFWSFANDVFSEAQGTRLFPLIAIGGTLGGIAGAQIAARLTGVLSSPTLLAIGAVLLAAHLALLRQGMRSAARLPPHVEEVDPRGGLRLLLADRTLLLIGGAVLLLNVVNTSGDFLLAQMVDTHARTLPPAERAAAIASFFGDFQTAVTVLTFLLQTFLVARLLRVTGIDQALVILPVVSLLGYGAIAVAPLLAVAAVAKTIENAGDYSLQNTLQQALFLRTSRAVKYKGKAVTDTVCVRLGDLVATASIALGLAAGLTTRGFAVINMLYAFAWLTVAARLMKLRHAPGTAVETWPA